MPNPLNFQQIIMTLQEYWADQGCLVWQPYSEKVGAGTANPATTLRALGPEPRNVAYVEPSFRPDDGRYGDNPNRMQMHIQFQVILKPDPGNPQDLYLGSLEAIGIDLSKHDIRFVEDNWEAPALGAWGLGWEVWLDGLEITQFTYFQQAGGIDLFPVPVEITYGIDRLEMFLEEKDDLYELFWSDDVLYKDLRFDEEREFSEYNFSRAGIRMLRQSFTMYLREAKALVDKNLLLPAYDMCLKCSHSFNLLDSRGAISVTERVKMIGQIREQVNQIAEKYVERRTP